VLVPDGEWIAFVSERHNPSGGSFAIYMIHLNGTGLRRADGGRPRQPVFQNQNRIALFRRLTG
jgi:Tol biopolymer transport system component